MSGPHFSACLLTTAYLPPVDYFFAIAHSDRLLLEQHENYQKQSWRSRPIRDIRIDYGEPWLQHHIRAFSAAYNASAYYDYYADDLLPILEKKPAFLFDLNLALLEKLLVLLDLSVPVALTERYEPGLPGDVLDGRARIQPKYKGESLLAEYGREQAYYQVFVNRIPGQAGDDGASTFIPNLSILDLLSAEGPDAGKYLL